MNENKNTCNIHWKKPASLTTGARKTRYLHIERNQTCISHSVKNQLQIDKKKQKKKLSIQPETLNMLEEKVGSGHRKHFIGLEQAGNKATHQQMRPCKIKMFLHSKIKLIKQRQPMEWGGGGIDNTRRTQKLNKKQ